MSILFYYNHINISVSFLEVGFVFQNARPPGQRQPAWPPGDQRGGQGAAAWCRVPEFPLCPLHLLPGRYQCGGGWTLQPSSQPDECIPRVEQPQGRKRCVVFLFVYMYVYIHTHMCVLVDYFVSILRIVGNISQHFTFLLMKCLNILRLCGVWSFFWCWHWRTQRCGPFPLVILKYSCIFATYFF